MKNNIFPNLAVFVLFFGIALIEAVLFSALGVLSLWADFRKN